MQLEFLEPIFNEINMIINSQKNNKAPEEDNINPKLLKLAGPHLVIQLQRSIGTWKYMD